MKHKKKKRNKKQSIIEMIIIPLLVGLLSSFLFDSLTSTSKKHSQGIGNESVFEIELNLNVKFK